MQGHAHGDLRDHARGHARDRGHGPTHAVVRACANGLVLN